MDSKAISKRERIIADMVKVREDILATASQCPVELQDKAFLGIWTVKDFVAHLIGWDFTNIKAVKAVQNGRLPDFYTYIDKDWSSYNALLVIQYKQKDYDRLLARSKDSHRQLMKVLETLPVEDFFKDWGVRYKGYNLTISRLVVAETKDERIHLAQINAFVEQPLTVR
jgi:hypothetical protein